VCERTGEAGVIAVAGHVPAEHERREQQQQNRMLDAKLESNLPC
jgi:hypothetical protein